MSIIFTLDKSYGPCQGLPRMHNIFGVLPTTCAKTQTCVVNAMYVSRSIRVCGKEHTCLFLIKYTLVFPNISPGLLR